MKTAIQFPGQGAYIPGIFARLELDSAVETLAEIDTVVKRYNTEPISPLLLESDAPSIEELSGNTVRLNVALFAASAVLFRVLEIEQRPFDVLIGHSGGEIAALSAAGVITVEDATRVICERSVALTEAMLPEAGMLAVEASANRTTHLVAAANDWSIALAAQNTPHQTIISGLDEGLALVERLARTLGWRTSRLATAHPFHNTLLTEAANKFSAATKTIELSEPKRKVYSPILGGYITDTTEIRQLLRKHFTWPVLYLDAIRKLHEDGITSFIECGAGQILTGLVTEILPSTVRVSAPLSRRVTSKDLTDLLRQAFTGGASDSDRSMSSTSETAVAPLEPAAHPLPKKVSHHSASGTPQDSVESNRSLPDRENLLVQMRIIFAESIGYPVDVFTDDADLEAELGISSVKRVEIFGKLLNRYQLRTPPVSLKLRSFRTLPSLADLLYDLDSESNPDPVS